VIEIGDVQTAAQTVGLEVAVIEIRRGEDIAPGFETLKGRAMLCMSHPTRFSPATEFASTFWRWAFDCPRSTPNASMSNWEV